MIHYQEPKHLHFQPSKTPLKDHAQKNGDNCSSLIAKCFNIFIYFFSYFKLIIYCYGLNLTTPSGRYISVNPHIIVNIRPN